MKLWQKTFVPALCVGIVAAGVSEPVSAQAAIKIDGSSTVFPVSEAFAEEFQISKRGKVRVTVGMSGTGGGFKKFCRGETDMSNASRPILAEEMELCRKNGIKYIEMPVAFDALTVVINPKNDWVKGNAMTIADLKKMWEPAAQGRINQWKQVRGEWPAEKLMLFGPGADSGTFDYFTEAVNGKSKASRGDFTASEDDNTLVQGVVNNKSALGYFGFAYYAAHKDKLRAVAIDGGKGPVLPSIENVINGTYSPLSRPLFVYVRDSSATRPEMREFVQFIMKQGSALVTEVGYVPLPESAYASRLEALRQQEARHRVRRPQPGRHHDRATAVDGSEALMDPQFALSRRRGGGPERLFPASRIGRGRNRTRSRVEWRPGAPEGKGNHPNDSRQDPNVAERVCVAALSQDA
jgi:phosphate transport system substrate-binding protein